jgi:hypothetical protein
VTGAAGISAADYVRAYPNQIPAVVAVEMCSLTLQKDDVSELGSVPNIGDKPIEKTGEIIHVRDHRRRLR